MSISIDCAKPAINAPTMNTVTPARKIRLRPVASPRRPDGTRSRPNASAYPEITHCRLLESAPNVVPITGRATLITDSASSAMNNGTISGVRILAVLTGRGVAVSTR